MKTLSILSAAVLLGSGASLFAADATAEGYIRKSFQVSPGGKLNIKADRGSIDVKTGASDKVEIVVTREPGRGADSDILEKHQVTFTQDGNDVNVVAEMPGAKGGGWFGGGNNLKVRYEVTVPAKYNVNLKSSGGSINIGDMEGEARAETSGGGLKFGAINGPVRGRTSGGSISVNGATQNVDVSTSGGGIHIGDTTGNVVAHTSGGSVHIGNTKGSVIAGTSGGGIQVESASGPVKANTSGGSIRATMTQPPTAACTFQTSGGGIELKLASTAAIDLEASTSGGSVSTDFSTSGAEIQKKTHVRAKLNGGGPKVTLGTSGGSIKIRKI
jgi:hypothetical protein